MKTVLKFLTLGLMLAAFGAISVTSTFAQATVEECEAIYQKFLANRTGDISKLEIGVAAGKEYLEKCKEGQEDVKAYVEKNLPKVQTRLDDALWQRDVIDVFNSSVPAKNWDKTFEAGKKIIGKNPDFIDVMLVLASVGFDAAAANNDKYNADTVSLAKLVLQKLSEGKPSVTGDFGAGFQGVSYIYKTKNCPDGKINATGWMNYTIGYISFYRQKNQKEAAPYLYKALQVGCETTKMGDIYRMIGSWYIEEFKKIDDERIKKIETNGGQDNDETKAMLALERGYMERIADSYARASKLATTQANKDAWMNRAKDFYKFRFDNDLTNFDKWIAESTAKTFVDPSTAVTPVVVDETKATTTPAGATAISNDTSTAPTADTRPRTANTTAKTTTPATKTPATTTPTTTPATTAATTKKAPAKKPAPKKKGTR